MVVANGGETDAQAWRAETPTKAKEGTVMKVVWAPWRMAYIKKAHKPRGCIFCTKAREKRDASNYLLHRGRYGFVMMNLFPYNSGHLLVSPYSHVKSLEQLPDQASLDLIRLTNLALQADQKGPQTSGLYLLHQGQSETRCLELSPAQRPLRFCHDESLPI